MNAVRWEYRVVTFQNTEIGVIERELDGWGAAGWELVSLSTTVKFWGRAVNTNSLVGVMKRPALGEVDRNATPDIHADMSGWL